tara:strand:+ start:48 stop:434 length:387 start_codon:yes stop_codon:yes gene_type:complete
MSFLSKHFSLNKIFSSPLNKNHPGHVVPDSIVTSKSNTELNSKNGKEKEKFQQTSTSQEIDTPNNVSRTNLKYRNKNGRKRSVQKFKAVKDGKLLKSKSVNGKNVRETERNISNKAQNRKAKRLLKKK